MLDSQELDYDYEEDYSLSDDEVLEIQDAYRRRRIREMLIGPIISTLFHVSLIILLAVMITDKFQPEAAEIEVKMEEIEEIKIEEPPPIEEPEPVEDPVEDVTDPVLTTVAIETVETNDSALEDTNDEAPSTNDDSMVEAVSDVTVSPSAFASPSVFGGSSAAGRASAISKFGGSQVGQQSLLKALWWLAKVQNPDSSWGNSYKPAMSSLALLTFLAHGETPTSKSFGKTVRKAMEWLVNDPIDTKINRGYHHAIKTYAISEAFAMTGVSFLEEAMNACVKEIIDGQQTGGSFGYEYDKNMSERQDLSLGGWNYQALKAAYAAGCEVSGIDNAVEISVKWLKDNSNLAKGFPYNSARNTGGSDKHTMRAVGCLCLQLFGHGDFPDIQDDIQRIATEDLANYNWKSAPEESLYGWYYATQVMFQKGGTYWKNWNRKFQRELTTNQHSEGYWEYPSECHGNMQNKDILSAKVYATCLSALQLTVYYRYLPSSSGAIGAKDVKKEAPVIMEEEGLDLIE